jgi:hypothetical protein
MPIASPYEYIYTVMFRNTKHDTKRLISTAHAAGIVKFALAAPLRTFSAAAANQVCEFLKYSWAVLNKSTRLADLRTIAGGDSEVGLVKLVEERSSCALVSKHAGGGCSTAA